MKSEIQKIAKTQKQLKQAKRQGKNYEKQKRNVGRKKGGIPVLLAFLVVILVLFACRVLPEEAKGNEELEAVELVRVVDGDTLIVSKDGEEVRLRMLCVNCEESVHKDEERNTEKGREASAFTKEYLEDYDTIYLQYDEDMYDQYDRMLAYVWLTDDVDVESKEDVKQYMFNAILLEEGHAEVVVYEPNHRYAEWFYEIIGN